jgi:hypothetical protein
MLDMFDDWQAKGITAILHEERGGHANNKRSLAGLAAKADAEGYGWPPAFGSPPSGSRPTP